MVTGKCDTLMTQLVTEPLVTTPTRIDIAPLTTTFDYQVEAGSQTDMILNVSGEQNLTITISLQPQSRLNLLVLQEGTGKSTSQVSHTFNLEEGATLHTTWLTHQNHDTIQFVEVTFNGENSHADLCGLGRLKDTQHMLTQTNLIHIQPNTTATQYFKRIVEDAAVSDFQGLVHVKAEAQKTDSNQYSHNLLLSDQARALVRPQLEIFADDVKCSHGATIGQMDDEQVFYLQSRGFSIQEAKSMLLTGFMDEIIDKIPFSSDQATYRSWYR